MIAVDIVELDSIEDGIADEVRRFVARTFGLDTRRIQVDVDLDEAFDPGREQVGSHVIMGQLQSQSAADGSRLLGLVGSDLFLPMLSFVFGHAQLEGPVALVSLARLRQDFYGLRTDASLLLQRVETEVAHELGHTFGLHHCPDRTCCMSLSTSIEEVDAKRPSFCRSCRARLREWRVGQQPSTELEPQSEGSK